MNVVSLDPQNWYILWSNGTPPHPSADPAGAWSIQIPELGTNMATYGHLNYVETPFKANVPLHQLTITFRIVAKDAQYQVWGDHLPPTCRVFFQVQNDNWSNADGRWWAGDATKTDFQANQDETFVYKVPLTSDHWTNVYGQHDGAAFEGSLANIGFVGITFGGQNFAGHGFAEVSGSTKFILINYEVN